MREEAFSLTLPAPPYKRTKNSPWLCQTPTKPPWLLSYLIDTKNTSAARVITIAGEDAYKKQYLPQGISDLAQHTQEFDKDILLDAALLLEQNGHARIEYNKENAYKNRIRALMEGELAYNEGVYQVQNKKDRMEAYESMYKGWVPFIALGLSILSLVISLLKK